MNFLQIVGGSFMLLSKAFFSFKEASRREETRRNYQILSWISCLIGIPLVATLFAIRHDWILLGVDIASLPSLLMGLLNAMKKTNRSSKRLDAISLVAVTLGVAASLYDFKGLRTPEQYLEITVMITFLIGTYLLAKDNPLGYFFYLSMNLACFSLVYRQDLHIFAVQQVFSTFFTSTSCFFVLRRRKANSSPPTIC